jgi:hypothetical protein
VACDKEITSGSLFDRPLEKGINSATASPAAYRSGSGEKATIRLRRLKDIRPKIGGKFPEVKGFRKKYGAGP